MLRKENPRVPDTIRPAAKVETVVGPGIALQGTLTGQGGVRLEGSFEGKILLEGLLVVGETAKIISEEIRAQSVSVAGTVQANIVAARVHITRTGRVWGDVTTGSLSTEEGGFLKGRVQMQDTEEPTAPDAAGPS
jgi:cytoskeletal protein CcmA (bactofilin family)